ncbi:MAG TPA: thiamine biosynthesis protein ThiF [Lentisphaeria bacterium]|nr:thiamine biosynthesis protein ThiF [Lentisphaeria bacterium]
MSEDRYSRQVRFSGIGESGQQKLVEASVLLVGCGGLGTVLADMLGRAGIGKLHIIDRDYVELSNLQRQMLFTTADATERLPKAAAARDRLALINPEITVEATIGEFSAACADELVADASLVIDGTDNLGTRYLINDACVAAGKPWIYGAAVGSSGMAMSITPGASPCFRCIFPEAPRAGSAQTCDTAGVLSPILHQVAAQQATLAFQLLTGDHGQTGQLFQFDCWTGQFDRLDLRTAKNPECVCCGLRNFEHLDAVARETTTSLCGRNAIQIAPATPDAVDLAALAERLRRSGRVTENPYLLSFAGDGVSFTVFRDGRAVVHETTDAVVARGIRDRYV